jgi:hypothetical protein
MSRAKRSAWIIQQGVWDMPKESMPLSAGYLKAAALADERIRAEMDVRIFNFGGGDSLTTMAETIFSHGVPDVLAFSVFGWNYRSFGHWPRRSSRCGQKAGPYSAGRTWPIRPSVPSGTSLKSTSSRTAKAT